MVIPLGWKKLYLCTYSDVTTKFNWFFILDLYSSIRCFDNAVAEGKKENFKKQFLKEADSNLGNKLDFLKDRCASYGNTVNILLTKSTTYITILIGLAGYLGFLFSLAPKVAKFVPVFPYGLLALTCLMALNAGLLLWKVLSIKGVRKSTFSSIKADSSLVVLVAAYYYDFLSLQIHAEEYGSLVANIQEYMVKLIALLVFASSLFFYILYF